MSFLLEQVPYPKLRQRGLPGRDGLFSVPTTLFYWGPQPCVLQGPPALAGGRADQNQMHTQPCRTMGVWVGTETEVPLDGQPCAFSLSSASPLQTQACSQVRASGTTCPLSVFARLRNSPCPSGYISGLPSPQQTLTLRCKAALTQSRHILVLWPGGCGRQLFTLGGACPAPLPWPCCRTFCQWWGAGQGRGRE